MTAWEREARIEAWAEACKTYLRDSYHVALYVFYLSLGNVSAGNAYAPFGYRRMVLHISRVHCPTWKVDLRGFLRRAVLCTDGETVGAHRPGQCPFRVMRRPGGAPREQRG
mgnify:CR=1 FL=1